MKNLFLKMRKIFIFVCSNMVVNIYRLYKKEKKKLQKFLTTTIPYSLCSANLELYVKVICNKIFKIIRKKIRKISESIKDASSYLEPALIGFNLEFRQSRDEETPNKEIRIANP